jgi:hypothetical protein
LLRSDPILENPRSLAAATDAQAEARYFVVEENCVAFAERKREAVDRGLGEFHVGLDPIWEGYGKVAQAISYSLVRSIESENLVKTACCRPSAASCILLHPHFRF